MKCLLFPRYICPLLSHHKNQRMSPPAIMTSPSNHNYWLFLASLISLHFFICDAFSSSLFSPQRQLTSKISSRPITTRTQLHSTSQSPDAPKTPEEDAALQWDLFTRYHAADGEWWGTWTSYDYMGELIVYDMTLHYYFAYLSCRRCTLR